MCLIVLAIESHPDFKLVICANRDEFHERPTAPADFWHDEPNLLAGRDLKAGGTWLGVTRTGRIAAITNYRDPASHKPGAPSRGRLVTDFLLGQETPGEYLDALAGKSGIYNGFNLIAGCPGKLYWYSNRGGDVLPLRDGIRTLSNHLLDTPWPKTLKAASEVKKALMRPGPLNPETLFRVLGDTTRARDEDLPETGVGIEWERLLSPVFISSPAYGTRSSTVLSIDRKNRVSFMERTYDPGTKQGDTRQFSFTINAGSARDGLL